MKVTKENSIYPLEFMIKKWWFGIFGIWWIWISFYMNIPCVRVFFNFFHKRIGESPPPPPHGKISWNYCRVAHFPKVSFNVLSKIDRNYSEKKKSLLCMGRNYIVFKLDFGENSATKKITTNELVCIFTKHIAYCCKSQCPHLSSSSVSMY